MHWRLAPDCRAALFGVEGLRLEEWLESGAARVIKTGPHCTVYRVTLPGLDFHLKHYRLFNTRAWLRQMLRPAKARTEFECGLAILARDLPTVEPLGIGEHGARPGDSILLTRTLPDAEPLSRFVEQTLPALPAARRVPIRIALSVRLGDLLARLHDAGVVHHDLHAGNLLVRLTPGDEPELFLIDLHAVRIGRRLGWQARLDNLIMLNRWFVLRSDRGDRARFWRSYRHTWLGKDKTPAECEARRESTRALEEATWESNLAFWANRDRRCWFNNRYYQKVRGPHSAGYAVHDLDAEIMHELLDDPDAVFARAGAVLLKNSPSSTVASLNLTIAGESRPVIYKRFRVTSWTDPWTALVRPTAPLRSWRFGHGLRERGLPTARPLLVLERRRHGLTREGYLLTEKIPDAVDVRTWLDQQKSLPEADRRVTVRRLNDRLARLIRELHRRNLSQRDLKAANILVSRHACPWSAVRDSDPPGPHLWLIDLVGIRLHADLCRKRCVQNLARLHASFRDHPLLTRTDRLRFLRTYFGGGSTGIAWKRWWVEVERATQAKMLRNERNGRPLA
jgi:tRNA A-37 threonylcarbamoyl transferase component Bud32